MARNLSVSTAKKCVTTFTLLKNINTTGDATDAGRLMCATPAQQVTLKSSKLDDVNMFTFFLKKGAQFKNTKQKG